MMIDILLVEDNEDHAELIELCVRKNPLVTTFFHVSDGQEALDYLFRRRCYDCEESYPLPRVVILDLKLPKVDGFEVLRQIKGSKLQHIPVIVFTTSMVKEDIILAYQCQANCYLVKSLNFREFQGVLGHLVRYWLRRE